MKTVAFANLVPDKLGAFEWLLVHMGRAYAAAGDELVLGLAAEPLPELARLFSETGIRWAVMPGWTDSQKIEHPWRLVRPAIRLIQKEQPDVVGFHFGNEWPSLCVRIWCGTTNQSPMAWIWQQQQQIRDPSWLTRHCSSIRFLSWGFNRLVPVYEGGRRSLLLRGIKDEKINRIYNGTTDFRPAKPRGWLRQSLDVSPDSPLAVTVGSLISRKRIEFLIETMADPEGIDSAMRLLVVGNGPERKALENLAQSKGIGGRILFLGARLDVKDVMAECDFYVHAATAEACAYSILEAMSVGLPVLSTDAGAAREQVEQGVTGFVTSRDDRGGFKGYWQVLNRDPILRKTMGSAGRTRWEKMFRVEESAREYHRLYAEMAERIEDRIQK